MKSVGPHQIWAPLCLEILLCLHVGVSAGDTGVGRVGSQEASTTGRV